MIKVSILIPTYNREEKLKIAIKSSLNQDYENLEVIVGDDGSSDNTPEIVKEFLEDTRFVYYRNEKNLGMVKNWRKGVYEVASGDYFLILGDDDYYVDNGYVRKAIDLIKGHENLLLVRSNGYLLYENTGKKYDVLLQIKKLRKVKLFL